MFRPGADQLTFAHDLARSGALTPSTDFEHNVPFVSDVDIRIKIN